MTAPRYRTEVWITRRKAWVAFNPSHTYATAEIARQYTNGTDRMRVVAVQPEAA